MSELNPVVAGALQQALVDLISLELQGKQAHWNIRGPRFRALHLALDELVDGVRALADTVAERLAQVGGVPDGRATTVYQTTLVDEIDFGVLDVDKTYQLIAEKVQATSNRIQQDIDSVDDVDHVSGDILIQIGAELDKQGWMLRSATE